MAQLAKLPHHVQAVDKGLASRRKEQRDEDLDQGGLAGAVGTEQAEALAPTDPQVDAVERDDLLAAGTIDAPKRTRLNRDIHGLEDFSWIGGQAALTAATSFVSESLASPNSMTVLGS